MSTMAAMKRKKRSSPSDHVGVGIRKARLAIGWSQKQLADAAEVDKTTVSHWERGECAPRSKLLPTIAMKLGTTIGALHGERASR